MSQAELDALGWEELDVLLISGDAYVDHPSFGIVLLARLLIAHGFRTGLVCQPRWQHTDDLLVMGRPRLFAGVGAGCVDSLVAHYTAFRKKRSHDAYTPGGRMGARPNRATIVYANLVRQAFPHLPLVIGGIEASTRWITHYDFWQDALRRPILFDAKADLLVYGMGERATIAIARALALHETLLGIPGTAWISRLEGERPKEIPESFRSLKPLVLPAHADFLSQRRLLLEATLALERHVHQGQSWAYEPCDTRCVVLAPPSAPLTTAEMDMLYDLPFTRRAHPAYQEDVPAREMLATSITSHRGCAGGCSFCSLAMHQGRSISSRSEASILREAQRLVSMHPRSRRQKGLAISDVGGPTANMWMAKCLKREREPKSICLRSSCCYPTICPFFQSSQQGHVELLRSVARLPGVSTVRVASGVRADLALREPEALDAYIREFTGGQLKLAPEHSEASVLAAMRKPPLAVFEAFLAHFQALSAKLKRQQFIVPYLMSAFPGCRDSDMHRLAQWLGLRHWSPQQTQCFLPTPGTCATAMYYAGVNEKGEEIRVARSDSERMRQHAILMQPEHAKTRSGRQTPCKSKRANDGRRRHGNARALEPS
ncbi:MAG: YgiQ family radical SAM protein [Desulfovibrio sp.]|nr:YgiQ family radical SAM protein [Desulfovibrio sp.]